MLDMISAHPLCLTMTKLKKWWGIQMDLHTTLELVSWNEPESAMYIECNAWWWACISNLVIMSA